MNLNSKFWIKTESNKTTTDHIKIPYPIPYESLTNQNKHTKQSKRRVNF